MDVILRREVSRWRSKNVLSTWLNDWQAIKHSCDRFQQVQVSACWEMPDPQNRTFVNVCPKNIHLTPGEHMRHRPQRRGNSGVVLLTPPLPLPNLHSRNGRRNRLGTYSPTKFNFFNSLRHNSETKEFLGPKMAQAGFSMWGVDRNLWLVKA